MRTALVRLSALGGTAHNRRAICRAAESRGAGGGGGAAAAAVARVHAIESFSAVDGPGVRYVVFLQGCHLRCKICANIDSVSFSGGQLMSSDDIIGKIRPLKAYLGAEGGVTMSGGEALNSAPFVSEVFRKMHADDLGTTCLDTAGQSSEANMDLVLPHTDFTMFCIKHPDPDKYREFTGQDQRRALQFWDKLRTRQQRHMVRYVLVPGYTDAEEDVTRLAHMMLDSGPCCEGLELLPYHELGVYKWGLLGLEYPMAHVRPPSKDHVARIRRQFEQLGIRVLS